MELCTMRIHSIHIRIIPVTYQCTNVRNVQNVENFNFSVFFFYIFVSMLLFHATWHFVFCLGITPSISYMYL